MKFVFPLLSFKKHGGVRVLSTLMSGLTDEGHEVVLVVPINQYDEFYPLTARVTRIFIDPLNKNPHSLLTTIIELAHNSPRSDYIVVSFFLTYYSALLHKITKKSQIIYYRQGVEQLFYPFPFSLLAEITYLLPQDFSPANSRWVLLHTRAKGPIINPPLDKEFLNRPQKETKDLKSVIIFYKKDQKKGPGRALQIMKSPMFSKYTINVIGEKPEEIGSNVKYAGFLSTSELVALYDQCAFAILTSQFEGFGLPPLEAMARGCIPLVYTKTGPLEYLQDGYNGFFVRTPEDVFQRMEELRNDRERFMDISKKAVETSKRFSPELFVSTFLKMLHE